MTKLYASQALGIVRKFELGLGHGATKRPRLVFNAPDRYCCLPASDVEVSAYDAGWRIGFDVANGKASADPPGGCQMCRGSREMCNGRPCHWCRNDKIKLVASEA